jgi:DNA-binding response OmpR family regulator
VAVRDTGWGLHRHHLLPDTTPLRFPPMIDVLVVADGHWVLNDVRAALDDGRYHLTEHTDPRTVADAMRDSSPGLVVVDLQIGSKGGMAVTRTIRNLADTGGIEEAPPVIMLLDRAADAFLAGRSGADAWVRKPLEGFELRETADRLTAALEQA